MSATHRLRTCPGPRRFPSAPPPPAEALGGLLLAGRPGGPPSPPSPAHGSETLFPEGALYSGFIFRGSANKFLPNCPQTKKVHISALKVTGGIADQAWHICSRRPRSPPSALSGIPLRRSQPLLRKLSIHLPTSLLTPSLPPDLFPGATPFPVKRHLVRS